MGEPVGQGHLDAACSLRSGREEVGDQLVGRECDPVRAMDEDALVRAGGVLEESRELGVSGLHACQREQVVLLAVDDVQAVQQLSEAYGLITQQLARVIVGQQAVLEELRRADPVVVSSFWSGALAAARSADPTLACGLLVLPSFDAEVGIAGALDLGCVAVHLPVNLVDGATVTAAHDAGLGVASWTVADAAVLAAVLDAGVDTVITDDVGLARRAVDGS